MFYLSLIAGIISIILTATGYWTLPIWVGVTLVALPALYLTFILLVFVWAAANMR